MKQTIADTDVTPNGIYTDISTEDYHRNPRLSSSGLKYVAKSMAHYLEYRANPPGPTKARLVGSAVHAGFLEGGMGNAVLLAPGATRNTNLYREFVLQNPGKIHLIADEYEDVQRIVDQLHAHPTLKALFRGGVAENSVFWTDPETGVECKCRPDYWLPDGTIIDLKTTEDASDEGIAFAMRDYKYHWQTAWYLDGVSAALSRKVTNFVHVFVEKTAPYGISIRVLADQSIESSRAEVRQILTKYAAGMKTSSQLGYPEQIQDLVLPGYLFKGVAS